jgi:dUTP pyrophosphatase
MVINENDLIFAKVKPNAIIPSKRDEDAGYDIYACFDEAYMFFKPHETKLVPTGIASAMNSKYYIQIEERGSTGCKGIKKSAGIIDSGFRNEWFIIISNINDKPLVIIKDGVTIKDIFGDVEMSCISYPYTKAIAQGIVHEVPKMNIKEVDYQELLSIESNRGVGQLGSSKK